MKERDQNPVDFISGQVRYTDAHERTHSTFESKRIFNILFIFKNSMI